MYFIDWTVWEDMGIGKGLYITPKNSIILLNIIYLLLMKSMLLLMNSKRLVLGNVFPPWFIEANLHLSWSSHFAQLCH